MCAMIIINNDFYNDSEGVMMSFISLHPHCLCRNQPFNTGDKFKFIKNIISTQGRYHLPSATPLHSQCFFFNVLYAFK